MTKEEILTILQACSEEILEKFKAEPKGIFGSFARGDHRPESDLDILVEFHNGATLLDLARLSNFLEDRLGIKIDIASQRAIRREYRESIYEDLISI